MERNTYNRVHVFLIILLGLCIFGFLNLLVVLHAPEAWTTLRLGAWTAFHKGFDFSGFDQFTYVIVTKWRPLFEMYRHPMLAMMIWPMSWINSLLTDFFHINCAIYIVAVVYTIISTSTWWLLYCILNKRIGLSTAASLLLMFFYFGLAYVMLAACVPDHMIWTHFLLLLTIYLASSKNALKWWQALLFYFISMGVTLTNSIKVWMIDMTSLYSSKSIKKLFKRSLLYFIPTLLVGAIYVWEQKTFIAEEQTYQERMRQRELERDSTARERFTKDSIFVAQRTKKQAYNTRLFAYTDNTIDRGQLLLENFFGEGFILHSDYLMGDANAKKNPRPVIVKYKGWWNYAVESCILILFAFGIWKGRKERLLWIAMMPFLFDIFLHIGMRFAATDVYIMTAHWAYIIPIAIGFILKYSNKNMKYGFSSMLTLLVLYLWVHNLYLLIPYMLS